MKTPGVPSRAILNFTHRCAMSCKWCYVPFNSGPAQKDNVFAVVERIAELGFTNITLGGGDPFQYNFIADLLRLAKSLGLFVHVDTHGKNLRESSANLELLHSTVDLIGLPLDGSNSSVHDGMRTAKGHFYLIQRRIDWLGPLVNKLKINTVISQQNSADLPALTTLINILRPARWSLYQYWPIGPGERALPTHAIHDNAFLLACKSVANGCLANGTVVEVNPRDSRRDTYPIIHHDGEIFVHAEAPFNQFLSLGSIYEADVLSRIANSCDMERPAAASRYTRISTMMDTK